MTSDSNSARVVRSAPRGKNLYERMEEARARRAEVLAAANDDASISTPAVDARDSSKTVAKETDRSDPVPVTLSRSTPSKTTRFPAIVVRPETDSGGDEKPKRMFGWFRSL